MLRRLRETAPVGLVPLAWLFAVAAHLDVLSQRAVLVGHVVMGVLLAAFAALSWAEMRRDPVLRAWLGVIVVGFLATSLSTVSLASGSVESVRAIAVLAWMVLPGLAYERTWRAAQGVNLDHNPLPYLAAAVGSLTAAGLFVLGLLVLPSLVLVSLVVAGLLQTAGIAWTGFDT